MANTTEQEVQEINLDEKTILGEAKLLTEKTPLFHFLGSGHIDYSDGKQVQVEYGLGQVTGCPMIKAKNSFFTLSWEDVFLIAFNHPDFKEYLTACKTTQDEQKECDDIEDILTAEDITIKQILEKISENAEDVELINSMSELGWRGGEIWFDRTFNLYLLNYGQAGSEFTDYCEHKMFIHIEDALEYLEKYVDISKLDAELDAEGCPVNEVGEENLDLGGDE